MADERLAPRDFDTRKAASWTDLFKTFLVALDPFKLLAAAAAIFLTSVGWWLLSAVFFNAWTKPVASDFQVNPKKLGEGDNKDELQKGLDRDYAVAQERYALMTKLADVGGKYRIMPWSEERGRNPFLVTRDVVGGSADERREIVGDFAGRQVPVMLEPLFKYLQPILGLFDSRANFWVRAYYLMLIVWMLLVWAFFGGVLTRMAVMQLAGKEGGGLRESIKFVRQRYLSYVFSPLVPLGLIFLVVIGLVVFGFFHLIPLFGDIFVDGLFWWIPLGAGFVMALLVLGLVGYPLMYTTPVRRGERHVRRPESVVQLRLRVAVELHLVHLRLGGLRGDSGVLRDVRSIDDGVPRQVGRQADAVGREEVAGVPVRVRADLLRLAWSC